MQVHNRLNDIISKNFKSHDVVTTAMSNFIMKTRVDRTQIEEVKDLAVEAKKLVAENSKKLATLTADFHSFKQATGNRLAALDKKVKAEEGASSHQAGDLAELALSLRVRTFQQSH